MAFLQTSQEPITRSFHLPYWPFVRYMYATWKYFNNGGKRVGINLTWETKALLDSYKKHKNFCRQTYSFLKVKLRRLRRNTYEDKYVIRGINILYLQKVLITQPDPRWQFRMQISNKFAENLIFCSARFGEDKTMRPHMNMSTLVRACNCNWSLRFLWRSEFEINSNWK